MDDDDCRAKAGSFSPPAVGWVRATPRKAARIAAWPWRSFLVRWPVVELTGLTFSIGFGEKKIELSRRCVTFHLFRPQSVIACANPRSQPAKIRRGKLLHRPLNFLNRAHDGKLPDLRKRFKRGLTHARAMRSSAGRFQNGSFASVSIEA